MDRGPNFQIWHDSWWNPRETIDLTVDTAGLILILLDIPGSWAIVTESIAHNFKKLSTIKISKLSDPPPARVCYKIKQRNPLTRSREPIEVFNRYLEDFISNNKYLTSL